MNKREFLKTGLLGSLALFTLPTFGRKLFFANSGSLKTFHLPELPYSFGALDPFISSHSVEVHYSKLHASYTDKLNKALRRSGANPVNIKSLLNEISKHNQEIRDHGGAFLNHRMFWMNLSPSGGLPSGKIARAIESQFGTYDNLKQRFTEVALSMEEPGWVWLINKNKQLKIVATTNNDNPLMDILPEEKKGTPLLCIDMWEHSYYQYRDNLTGYADTFWKFVNWEVVEGRYQRSI